LADAENALLVEEYCGGTDSYELSLPKGLIEPGEDVLEAANRELKEEAGFGARRLELLTELSLSPGYMSQKIQVVLARDLYPEQLPGDEPEPMRLEQVSLADAENALLVEEYCGGTDSYELSLPKGLIEPGE
ncbi:NUDIX domain-containing protein, partial [Acinetobacter baumannii]|uniref:NUDIX domain-containing protein n=1 Tax=Acinetobacter baumannii TaxID=470 RepID=UPI0009522DC4